ncbi:M20 family metallo-hydrolase [Larkinella knui]|uniref:M20/M25/M40 family metallo-hydrolase n=1 Tax=Larkinella knui TaxID=2025310 RepID=A0A3P1CR13_9BACT|nr:M20 family metallo-hydrolase [Larkinella knui]RRB15526.1 M20/M25/M40 family metallo-hydrolase [Larkinella knui]
MISQLTAYSLETQTESAIDLLKRLIATPSLSREEAGTALVIEQFFRKRGIPYRRTKNNVWTHNRFFDPAKPTLLLNSHHDTVKPNASWTFDPFQPLEREGKLYGLGSNDAGGCLVSLIATFCHFYDKKELAYNIVMAATAEEEISGREGLEMILPELPPIDFAIVGEPTQMQLAIAEKGLLVLDCTARGKSGHAARDEGDNAIYYAIKDIEWLKSNPFPKISPTLGPVKLSVTIINAGSQHNVVPDTCTFTVDVRATEQYTLEEIIETIRQNIRSTVQPRSIRLKPSSIPIDHPIVQAGIALKRETYGSPTTSDQALLDCPSLKCGPGHSERSHTADEFIYLREIEQGIELYIRMLEQIL